jgi:hypothetical protein
MGARMTIMTMLVRTFTLTLDVTTLSDTEIDGLTYALIAQLEGTTARHLATVVDPPQSTTRARLGGEMLTGVRGYPFPAALAEFALFADSSYGNDVTDSVVFAISGRPLTVWIDHADPAERHREFGWSPSMPVSATNQPPSRFLVCALVGNAAPHGPPSLQAVLDARDIADSEPLLETDDPDALIAYLRTLV